MKLKRRDEDEIDERSFLPSLARAETDFVPNLKGIEGVEGRGEARYSFILRTWKRWPH